MLRTLLLNVVKNDAVGTEDGDEELTELPQPATVNPEPGQESRGNFHSTLAQTIFSLCFEECITLFTMLMFQGLNVLDVRYVLLFHTNPVNLLFKSSGQGW